MITFKEYLTMIDLTESIESLHPELQKHIDNPKQFLKTKSSLEKSGQETGLTGEKFGSGSRFYLPQKNKTKIKFNGKDTEVSTGIKVHNPTFTLNSHHPDGKGASFGRDQNMHEADVSNWHGSMRQDDHGNWRHNPDGVVATVFSHGDNHDHLVQEKLEKFSSKRFEQETKSESHPKGMKFKHFHAALEREYALANGRKHYSSVSTEDMDRADENPHTERFKNAMLENDIHPGDITPRNLGHGTNHETGESRPLFTDAGGNGTIIRNYGKARVAKYSMNRH